MDEAADCDRVAILDRGRLVALDTPAALTATIGGDVIQVTTHDAKGLAERVARRFGVRAEVVDGKVHIERDRAHEFIAELVEAFPGEIDAVTFGKPTLEDVFVHYTGAAAGGGVMMHVLLACYTLWLREIVRFHRQRSRIVGALGSPLVFWFLIGSGLNRSFQGSKEMALQGGYLE